jgi:RecA/RadA recombinase
MDSMSLLRRLRSRIDELIIPSAPSGPDISASHPPSNSSSQPVVRKRRHHPKEAPFIRPGEYGRFNFRFSAPELNIATEKGDPMTWEDLEKHMVVFGGSGSGKTTYVLNQVLEVALQSTHLADGPERDAKKCAIFLIDGKGDYSEKTWSLALKYGRMDDVIFFGPNHRDNQYDLFGDPTEGPYQLANKMLAMMQAINDGKKSEDPFWDNNATKLFINLFLLHEYVQQQDSETEPMSPSYLNLLLMDKGQPRNAAEIEEAQTARKRLQDQLNQVITETRSLIIRLSVELEQVGDVAQKAADAIEQELETLDVACSQGPVDQSGKRTEDEKLIEAWQVDIGLKRQAIMDRRGAVGALVSLLEGQSERKEDLQSRLINRLECVRGELAKTLSASAEDQKRKLLKPTINDAEEIATAIQVKLSKVREARCDEKRICSQDTYEMLIKYTDLVDKLVSSFAAIEQFKIPEARYGALRRLMEKYTGILKEQKRDPVGDPIMEYFNEEFLNVVNDKTAGSVGMVASTMVSYFVHPPFSQLFTSKPTFTMVQIIDQGKMLILDMPTALYGKSAQLAAVAMKIDFFRTVLSRKRLKVCAQDGDGNPVGEARMINQNRPLLYFLDEFGTVATTGAETGEAGFADKAREFHCACVFGLQNLPIVLRRLPPDEVDSIFSMCEIKCFLRNTDPKTNEYASKVLGPEIKVSATINQSAMHHAFDQNKQLGSTPYSISMSRGARYDPGVFKDFKNGEGVVMLNPRFGKHRIRRVGFALHVIAPLEDDGSFPFPTCHETNS